jgi:hypothetical protein
MCLFNYITSKVPQTTTVDIHRGKNRSAISLIWNQGYSTLWKGCTNLNKDKLCLSHLLVELLQYIAVFLPDSSAAAWALCSHRMLSVLGIQKQNFQLSFDVLQKRNALKRKLGWVEILTISMHKERDILLSLIEKDLPDYIFCRGCSLLHHSGRPESYSPIALAQRHRFCYYVETSTLSSLFMPEKQSFSAIQGIMKRHCAGIDCTGAVDRFAESRSWLDRKKDLESPHRI